MGTIQEILKENFADYKSKHHVPKDKIKVVEDIIKCRTEKMGVRLIRCDDCGYQEEIYNSCRNRNCPQCQTYLKEVWINKRKSELVNTQYFHTIFTLPKELAQIFYTNQVLMYNILILAVSETLQELGRDKKHLGAQIGALLVLHTWSQKLLFHPHIHALVTGGGLKDNNWINVKKSKKNNKNFFVHVNIISSLFRGKFLAHFEKAYKKNKIKFFGENEDLYHSYNFEKLKKKLENKNWYTFCVETYSTPEAVIEYLGRYTHRVAISNSKIVKYENGHVWFKWRDNKDNGKEKISKVTVEGFIRRFLLHILPKGFVKIRYIGIWSNRNKKTKLKQAQICTKLDESKLKFNKLTKEQLLLKITKGKAFNCPCCGSDKFYLVGIDREKLGIDTS